MAGVREPRRWRRADGVLHRQTLGGALVLGTDATEPILLTGPGADVWDLLHADITEGDLIRALSERFEAPQAQVAADVVPLLDDLGDRGIIVAAP